MLGWFDSGEGANLFGALVKPMLREAIPNNPLYCSYKTSPLAFAEMNQSEALKCLRWKTGAFTENGS